MLMDVSVRSDVFEVLLVRLLFTIQLHIFTPNSEEAVEIITTDIG
jgi:hypothetical protein